MLKIKWIEFCEQYNKWLCSIIGHKFSQFDLLIFKIKNNPLNVERHGFSSITCPRCKCVFDPDNNSQGEVS